MNGSGVTADRADELQRGLVSHCYRMLGSVTSALDVADAVGPALAARDDTAAFDAATRRCLELAGRRPLPSDLTGPSGNPTGVLSEDAEILWLEPIPRRLMDDRPLDLGLIASLQRLAPEQRAATVLHLEGRPFSHLTDHSPAPMTSTASVAGDALLARYRAAFEQYDVPAITSLFTDDAIWEMPPFTSWFRGARDIGRLISTHCPAERPGDQYLLPLEANGQPAFAVYLRDPAENVHRAFQIQVLTLTATAVAHAVAFFDLSLFDAFQLPHLLTSLPPTPYDGTPKPHIERVPHHD